MQCLFVKIIVSAAVVAALAPLASAQNAPAAAQGGARTSVPAPASSALNLQLPASQNAIGDSDARDTGDTPSNTTVHGEVSTTVGYAKGYGTGIATGTDLDIEHQTDNGNEIGLRIHAVQSKGFPAYGYGPYGYPYRHRHGWGRFPAPASSASSADGG